MAYLFLTTDPFKGKSPVEDELLQGIQGGKSRDPIRRPYRGIQIKRDVYSTISIRTASGSTVPIVQLASSSSFNKNGWVNDYSDYILQSVQDQRMEKQQIIETFGDNWIYFFGERPRVMTFSGVLVNSEDFNWRSQFWYNYDNFLRGTKLVQANARAYISWDTIVVEGYVLTAAATESAEDQHNIPFNLTMVVTNFTDSSSIPSTLFPGLGADSNMEALNKELEDKRSTFIPTSAQVRLANWNATQGAAGKSILGTLRGGIRKINEMTTMVAGYAGLVDRVIGGRTVRLPVGISGYLDSVGLATVGAGSTTQAQSTQYNAATGMFENVTGPVRIRVPATAKFGAPWISPITGKHRGFIFENLDEYPLSHAENKTLSWSQTKEQRAEAAKRKQLRASALEEYNFKVLSHEIIEEAGGTLNDITETVNFARSNFGMVMSGLAFLRDPLTQVQNALGLGQIFELKQGAYKVRDKALLQRISQFVGADAASTFAGVVAGKSVGNLTQAVMGESYYGDRYREGNSPDTSYEAAYGNSNLDPLVTTDPTVQDTLDELAGDKDAAPEGSGITNYDFTDIYGEQSSPTTSASLAEKIELLKQRTVLRDEDASGIRSINDVDATIDPIR